MNKTNRKIGYVLIGLFIGIVISSGFVFAANEYSLSLFQAKLVFNGSEKQGSEKAYQYYNGQSYVPTSLVYNGTTYVPLKFFSESVGLPVKYEGKTKTIYVGKIPTSGMASQYLMDALKPYYIDGGYYNADGATMAGKTYNKAFILQHYSWSSDQATYSYNLEGKYEQINGLMGLTDDRNSGNATIVFYGDDEVITSVQLDAGSLPKNFEVDIDGVIKLDVVVKNQDSVAVGFADVMIK